MTTARSKAAEAPLVVLVDTREQAPLRFGADVVIERATLGEGDYTARGLEGVAAIERKSIGDLVGSLTFGRERFERELERLHGYAFRELVIEGDANAIAAGAYRSRATPQSILGSIAAIRVDFGIGVTWAGDAQLAAWLVERWLRRLVRQRLVTPPCDASEADHPETPTETAHASGQGSAARSETT
jgi:ERCC4-type nuclease